MEKNIFLIWNGWGLLFNILIILWVYLHIYFTIKFGSGTPIRKYLTAIPIIVVPATFILSGWLLGLLILPISLTIAPLIARVSIHK